MNPIKASSISLPVYPVPKIGMRVRIMVDGQYTDEAKVLRLFVDYDSAGRVLAFFNSKGDQWSDYQYFDASILGSRSDWLVAAVSYTTPRRTRAAYVSFAGDLDLTIDITSGAGAAVGDPAQAQVVVRVDRKDAVRSGVFVERMPSGEWRIAGGFQSSEQLVVLDVLGGDVYALAIDDMGITFSSGLAVTAGQRIRPTLYAGWLYEVTEPGTLPPAEPLWWAAVGDNASRPLGTARAIAVRYYQPLAHGPVPVEVI